MKKLLALGLILMATVASVEAQSGNSMTSASEMKKLEFLVGTWKGEGWSERGPEGRQMASINETVQVKAGGRVFVVEGIGRAKIAGGEGPVVHQAFAILYYDEKARRYVMRTFLADGQTTDAETNLADGVFEWGFQTPQVKVRYKLRLNDKGQWFEEGEYSMDSGKTYRKFFEMTLDKVK